MNELRQLKTLAVAHNSKAFAIQFLERMICTVLKARPAVRVVPA